MGLLQMKLACDKHLHALIIQVLFERKILIKASCYIVVSPQDTRLKRSGGYIYINILSKSLDRLFYNYKLK